MDAHAAGTFEVSVKPVSTPDEGDGNSLGRMSLERGRATAHHRRRSQFRHRRIARPAGNPRDNHCRWKAQLRVHLCVAAM